MNIRIVYYFIFYLLFNAYTTAAQYITVDDTFTPQQLVEDVLINSSCAVVSNISVNGGAFTDGSQSYGYFSGSGTSFPFQNGVILSTGRAFKAEGPNTTLLDDGNNINWQGDDDLEDALNINNSINATVLEFDFVPLGNRISFDYMLSSEEYHDNAPCNYSDGFAFLLREANSTGPYENLAVIPGTNIPVKVTSVHPKIGGSNGCPAQNEEYFGGFNGNEHPTNFNGQTAVLTAVADVEPGVTYHIKLVIADEGNYRYDSAIFLGGGSFDMVTNLGPDRLIANGNPLCSGELYTLDATSANATDYQWYKNGAVLTGETGATYTVSSPGTYSVNVTFTPTCISEGDITLEYAMPVTLGSYTLLQCDDDADGFTTYNLDAAGELATGGNQGYTPIAYFETIEDAEVNTNPINNIYPYSNTVAGQQIFVTVQNEFGCQGIATVTLSTSSNTVNNPTPIENCDTDGTDDGITVFDLTLTTNDILDGLPAGLNLNYYTSYNDALTQTNAITQPGAFTNTVAELQTIYARIFNAGDCYGIAEVSLTVHSFGGELEDEEVILCQNESVILNAGAGYETYTWDNDITQNTASIEVDTPGTYTVTVTNSFECEGAKTFTVMASGPPEQVNFDIKDFTGNNNSVMVTAQGAGNYLYSIDGINYQPEPVFTNLPAGEYTFYVSDTNGCGPIFSQRVYVLDYPKYFTPNGDNTHETWRIPFMNKRPGIAVTIYDRYGKLITGFTGNSPGWDGTYNGSKLPADDYWFKIKLDNGKIVKGHFALIR